MIKKKPAERSQRQLRVGHEIRRIISDRIIRAGFLDAAHFPLSVTLTEVQVSPDLKNATVYVVPLGGDNEEILIEALTRQVHHYRSSIAKQLRTKYVPNLYFKVDKTFDQAEKISRILNQPHVRQDIDKKDDDDNETSSETS